VLTLNKLFVTFSPGAGLQTADEQADAAYADLINTTMDQRGIDELSEVSHCLTHDCHFLHYNSEIFFM
jgi:hypothetical protein